MQSAWGTVLWHSHARMRTTCYSVIICGQMVVCFIAVSDSLQGRPETSQPPPNNRPGLTAQLRASPVLSPVSHLLTDSFASPAMATGNGSASPPPPRPYQPIHHGTAGDHQGDDRQCQRAPRPASRLDRSPLSAWHQFVQQTANVHQTYTLAST